MNDLTNGFLKSEFGNSFYKELYHLKDSDNTVVLNESTGMLLVRKRLKYYDIRVFEYLKNNPHTNLARIIDFYKDNDELIVYEEFIQGMTLSEYLASDPSFSDLKKIVNEVFDAVIFIHKANPSIIHRDIKLSNIMITSDGVAKLIDFDAAKCFNPDSSKDTVLLGTEGYAAPEQYGFGSSDVRTDIYGLGKLISEVFGAQSLYERLIKKATHIDPDKRFTSVSAMKQAFNHGISMVAIPGFRNTEPIHIFKSIIGYIILIWFLFNTSFEHFSLMETRVAQVLLFGLAILWIDMFSGISPIFTKMPLTSSESSLKRLLGYLLYMLITFVVAIIFISSIIMLFRI
ncbi:MAG: protein kinase [Saccharofermentans sp.]|nr:protein kinase [Saccharofermentans sp.]